MWWKMKQVKLNLGFNVAYHYEPKRLAPANITHPELIVTSCLLNSIAVKSGYTDFAHMQREWLEI